MELHAEIRSEAVADHFASDRPANAATAMMSVDGMSMWLNWYDSYGNFVDRTFVRDGLVWTTTENVLNAPVEPKTYAEYIGAEQHVVNSADLHSYEQ